jgi:hypothetical protein
MKSSLVVMLVALAASAAHGEIYTWKDSTGTAYFTNSLHEIPARYLKKAKVLDVATGKTGGPATAHPPQATAPVAQAPGQQPAAVVLAPPVPSAPAAGPSQAPLAAPPAAIGNGMAPPTRPTALNAPLPVRDRKARRSRERVEEE